MTKRLTTDEFVKRSKEVWGDRWDYSNTSYVRMGSKVSITCFDHGPFEQIAQTHLESKVGCRGCKWGVWDTASFTKEAQKLHGDTFDYSKTHYTRATQKVSITCRQHGDFQQLPGEHLKSTVACPGCLGRKVTTESVVEDFKSKWGDRFDYSRVTYVNWNTPVEIICPKHGSFRQVPSSHKKGHQGCPSCYGRVFDTESFIEASAQVQTNHSYSETQYTGNQLPVRVKCNLHGEYDTVADYHVQGYTTCPGCKTYAATTPEAAIKEILTSAGFRVDQNRRDVIPPMEIDLFIPDNKVGIEFNGLYWHSSKFLPQDYHYKKYLRAQELGVRLIQVWEDDWNFRPEIVTEHILHTLGASSRPHVGARHTQVEAVSGEASVAFLNQFHIQGSVSASHHLGLWHSGELVAVGSFKRQGDDYVLARYATSRNVMGGHSKIVTAFERAYSYNKLITFADLTFSAGVLYRATGWLEDSLLKPDYSYVVGSRREHKFKYRKIKFQNDPSLKYEEGLTETQLAELNNLLRVYDAGKIRFIKPHPIL